MAQRETAGPITLSVIDRLIDKEPKNSAEAPMTRKRSKDELMKALKRDLEWLLNTRRTIDPVPESARETSRSVYHYGFADLSSRSVLSSKDHSDLVREMEYAIATFEPRLKRARVKMEKPDGNHHTLRFTIEGLLCMDPSPEPVRFDTVLEVGKWVYEVKGEDGA